MYNTLYDTFMLAIEHIVTFMAGETLYISTYLFLDHLYERCLNCCTVQGKAKQIQLIGTYVI